MVKKICMVFLCFMVVGLSACGRNDKGKTDSKLAGVSLEEIMVNVYKGFDEERLPVLSNTVINEENLAYYTGLETLDYSEGLASEPMIGSIAHSVVLLRVSDGVDIEKIKKDIKSKVDPRKWICVQVNEKDVVVDSRDNIIILIMVNDISNDILKNFKAI